LLASYIAVGMTRKLFLLRCHLDNYLPNADSMKNCSPHQYDVLMKSDEYIVLVVRISQATISSNIFLHAK